MKYKLPQSYYDTIARIKEILFGKKKEDKKEDKEKKAAEKPPVSFDE